MGMIRSKITVVDDFNNREASEEDPAEKKSDYKIPIDSITVAQIIDGKQTVSSTWLPIDSHLPLLLQNPALSYI